MPTSFNTPLGIFLFGCAGAIAPELIRLYKLRLRADEIRFRPSYFALILPFVILGGIVAVVLDTSPVWGAFAAGAAVEYTVSAVASSSSPPQRRELTDTEITRIADRVAEKLADRLEHDDG